MCEARVSLFLSIVVAFVALTIVSDPQHHSTMENRSPMMYISTTFTEHPQTWSEAREFAKSQGGRLPTNEEVNQWLNGKALAERQGKDTWVPTFLDSSLSVSDWIQIGDGRFGKSHVEKYGYPTWGDNHDPQCFKGPILIKLGLETPSDFKYITSIPHQSWFDARAYARSQGGRLVTNEEAINWLKGKAFSERQGKDTWIPTFFDKTLKVSDWVQIGDNRFGQCHRAMYGYPDWGDSSNVQPFRGPILIRLVPDEYETSTYDFFVETQEPVLIQSALGDVYVHLLDGGHGNGNPIALWNNYQPSNPIFKWYIKKSPMGLYFLVSAVDTTVNRVLHQHGGTDNITLWEGVNQGNTQVSIEDAGNGYYYIGFPKGSGKYVTVPEGSISNGTKLIQKKKKETDAFKWRFVRFGLYVTISTQTWYEASTLAKSQGGRLPTNEEVRFWLNGVAYSERKGKDTWVPTYHDSSFAVRDWVQIGDGRFGQSHVDNYGYPSWGDSNEPQPYKGTVLIKFAPEPKPDYLFIYTTPVENQTWSGAKALAKSLGGRLVTNDEVKNWLNGKAFVERHGRDTWIPTFSDDTFEISDWVQIGDGRFGQSHVDNYGCPSWGDSNAPQPYKGPIFIKFTNEDKLHLGKEPFFIYSDLGHNLVLDVEGEATEQANLISYPFHGGKNQQFTYENGFIKNINSGLVFDVASGVGEGHQIIQYPPHGGANQQFEFRSDGSIAVKGTNIVLTVQDGKTDATTHVIARTFVPGTAHQLWKLKPVSSGVIVKLEESVMEPRPVEGRPDQTVHEEILLEYLSDGTVIKTVTTITITTIVTKTVTVTTTKKDH